MFFLLFGIMLYVLWVIGFVKKGAISQNIPTTKKILNLIHHTHRILYKIALLSRLRI